MFQCNLAHRQFWKILRILYIRSEVSLYAPSLWYAAFAILYVILYSIRVTSGALMLIDTLQNAPPRNQIAYILYYITFIPHLVFSAWTDLSYPDFDGLGVMGPESKVNVSLLT